MSIHCSLCGRVGGSQPIGQVWTSHPKWSMSNLDISFSARTSCLVHTQMKPWIWLSIQKTTPWPLWWDINSYHSIFSIFPGWLEEEGHPIPFSQCSIKPDSKNSLLLPLLKATERSRDLRRLWKNHDTSPRASLLSGQSVKWRVLESWPCVL